MRPASSLIWPMNTKSRPNPRPAMMPSKTPPRWVGSSSTTSEIKYMAGNAHTMPMSGQRGRTIAGRQPDDHRHQGTPDRRERGDHAHPGTGESAVQEHRADAGAHSGERAPPPVAGLRGAADDEGRHGVECRGRHLRHHGDLPRTRLLGEDAAEEVRNAVRQRRQQSKDDRHGMQASARLLQWSHAETGGRRGVRGPTRVSTTWRRASTSRPVRPPSAPPRSSCSR